MTTSFPTAGPVRWHEIYQVPPRLRLETVGPWCPLDDSQLHIRLSERQVMQGWDCRVCAGAWNRDGSRGWWPTHRAHRVTPGQVTGVVVGSAAAAGGIAGSLAGLGDPLVLAASAVPATATLGILTAAAVGRVRDWHRYRHNVIVRVVEHSPAAPAGLTGLTGLTGEVSDGRA